MREIFFNSFKEKILNGEVGPVINASGIPMNEDFLDTYDTDDISIEQYRNLDDFDRFSKGNKTTSFNDTKFKYDMYGVDYQNYYEDDLSEKPIFVNSDNSGKFLKVYGEELCYNSNTYVKNKINGYLGSDDININSGFYYVTKKSHLNWLAKRVNDDYNFNNRLIIVLGDDIGTDNETSGTGYESVIGENPNKPFQGVFDLNGHAIHNLNLHCKKNSNGIIGYLGTEGVVKDGLVISPQFTGMNKISLYKISNDCSDVVCGTLVGTNYGTVENIITSGTMRINQGFCPEVYVAGNKAEYQAGMNTYEDNNYTNAFFPGKFCINSIYNVIPYVGYFCEGADSYFNDIGHPDIQKSGADDKEKWKDLTSACVNVQLGMDIKNSQWKTDYGTITEFNLDHYLEGKLANNSHCDLHDVELTRVIPDPKNPLYAHGFNWNYNQYQGSATATINFFALSNSSPDTIWIGLRKIVTPGNRYFADIYREMQYGLLSSVPSYIRPLITMSNDQVIPDRLMKNTVKSIGKMVSFVGDEIIGGLDKDLGYMYEYSDYAANLAHQIRDQIAMFYSLGNGGIHVTTHQKMNPYSRIAYYLSPIVGNNFGTIRNIDCRHAIEESKHTFVGFIGNVCGKENCGDIYDCRVDLDICKADNLIKENEAENELDVRQYRDTNPYMPDYASMNSAYNNMLNFFGYNYDYYQTSAGLTDWEVNNVYPEVSADCVKVSNRFYNYHGLCPHTSNPGDGCVSGLQDNKVSAFVFNDFLYTGPEVVQVQTNFRVNANNKPDKIGDRIPDEIRNRKLQFELYEYSASTPIVPAGFAIIVNYDTTRTSSNAYLASYKFYNPYDKTQPDNLHISLTPGQVTEMLKPETGKSGWWDVVGHMDLNYLGDAAKCLNETDTWTKQEAFTKADGSSYTPTVGDIMSYCSAFNGSLGNTLQNAKNFCRNMMDAKVAMGFDMLGNQTMRVDYTYPNYNKPFGGNNDYFFGSTLWHKNAVIPSGYGPNDTTTDWKVGGSDDNLTDAVYYMGPAGSKYDDNGPESFKTGISPNNINQGNYVNEGCDNPGVFCSVHPYGLWDIYGKPENGDAKIFDEIRNASRPSILRSMLTVTWKNPRAGLAESLAKQLINWAIDHNTNVNNIITSNPTASTTRAAYQYQINKIYVPFANRTQHDAFQSSKYNNLDSYSGIFLKEVGQVPVAHAPEYQDADQYGEQYIGNLDFMYIDCSVSVPVEPYTTEKGYEQEYDHPHTVRYETFPFIFQIPVKELYFPISVVNIQENTRDVANYKVANEIMTELKSGTQTLKVRNVNAFHLIPAYDLTEAANSQIQYKLKSIYNIGGIAGMINHSEKFIEHGNVNDNDDTNGPNVATCGSIKRCRVNITQRTNQFVQDLQSCTTDSNMIDMDTRTIGIANKIGGVAAIYEYRQNDMGTSPYNGLIKACTDGLMRFSRQGFRFEDISIGGEENVRGYDDPPPDQQNLKTRDLMRYLRRRTQRKIFSPFIEWANVSNMLDTTNFFVYKEKYSEDLRYLAHHSSNFPIDGNPKIYTSWMNPWYSESYWLNGESSPKALSPQIDGTMLSKWYPIPREAVIDANGWKDDGGHIDEMTDYPNQAYEETMARYGSTSASMDVYAYSSPYQQTTWQTYPRLGMHKRYEWIPGYLLDCKNIYLYGTSKLYSKMQISMSPMANSPCSDYNDIYLQMFSGNPNFVNRKLSKPSINAYVPVEFIGSQWFRSSYDMLIKHDIATDIEKIYIERGKNKYRDKYFTWDYETSARKSVDPLRFTIRYKKPKGHSRGLWIHQEGEGTYDDYKVLRYAMKGGDRGINDGACLHLGYLPSDWGVVQILNADEFGSSALPINPDTMEKDPFEEGHAVSGFGFNGMLLFDQDTKDLICYFDTEDTRDFDIGCWVAPLSEKVEIEDRKYGLLTEIVAENSPNVEQDPSDNTKVTIVENIQYIPKEVQVIEPVKIVENIQYIPKEVVVVPLKKD